MSFMEMIQGKNIIVGVCGGIAAYKSADIVSRLKKQGCQVKVIMTENATEFISPLTFEALSNNPVYSKMFHQGKDWDIHHISLAKWADTMIIAPITANVIGKVGNGISDDLLTSVLMATRVPLFFAPAMNTGMYENPVVQENMDKLKQRGVQFIDSTSGILACGDVGKGRMAEPIEIVGKLIHHFQSSQDFKGKRVLITAGPTREYIDPVRFISNPSTGKMGYALAEACAAKGAKVTIVSGPVTLKVSNNIEVLNVVSANDMYEAVMERYASANLVIATAAVADYKPKHYTNQKIKKGKDVKVISLELERTPDILKAMGEQKKQQVLVGFAAETENIEENANEKLQRKQLDYIVANNILENGAGFSTDTNKGFVLSALGEKYDLPLMNKQKFAEKIIDIISKKWNE